MKKVSVERVGSEGDESTTRRDHLPTKERTTSQKAHYEFRFISRYRHGFPFLHMKKYIGRTGSTPIVEYRKTQHKEQFGKVFDDCGLEESKELRDVFFLLLGNSSDMSVDNIIEVIVEERSPV